MSYYSFLDEDGERYGSFETEYHSGGQLGDLGEYPRGWFWQACFPGCMPDGDPSEVFATEAEAICDALELAPRIDSDGDTVLELGTEEFSAPTLHEALKALMAHYGMG